MAQAALVHLTAARDRGDAGATLKAATSVLAAGLTTPAVEQLERLALAPETTVRARRLLAEVLEQNLRFDEAIATRTALAQSTRDQHDLEALARLLRRRHHIAELVALLRTHPETCHRADRARRPAVRRG